MLMLSGILLGILVGLIMGLTGAGGGILAIPALMYGMDMELIQAKPVALIAVGLAAMAGSIQGLRQKLVRYRAALVMALAGLVTAPLGVMLGKYLQPEIIQLIYVVVMLISAIRILLSHQELIIENNHLGRVRCPVSETSGRFIWTPISASIIFSIGAVAGFFTGLLGVGGGFIIVPVLLAVSSLPLNAVVATSLMVITLNSIVTIALTLQDGTALTIPLWAFVACTILGLIIGRSVANKLPEKLIGYGFSALGFILASVMITKILM
jgi:uncharacterized membrane protein YfcA